MRTTLITAAALSVAAVLSGAGLALASTGHPSGTDRARTEHFRIISTAATATRQSLLATGAFVAGGTAVIRSGYDEVELYRGSFRLYPVVTYRSAPAPPARCLFTEVERGTYRIADGAGRYRRLTGSGKFTLKLTGVLASTGTGQCGRSLVTFQQLTYASGPVRG